MPELLFELGCEEIPAEDLFVLREELPRIAAALFKEQRLVFGDLNTDVGPRRLTLHTEIELMQQELREQKMGPPKKAAFDQSGAPTQAAIGFAKNLKVAVHALKTVETPRGEYLSAELVVAGRPAEKVLKEILPEVVKNLPFRKYMKWGKGDYVFGRPIRNLLCLFNGNVIRLKIAGVTAGRTTFGHRFLGNSKIVVESYEDYRARLEQNGVILRSVDRTDRIGRELDQHAKESDGSLKDDPELLQLMAHEVEYPEVLSGAFSPEFLSLPQEILMNAMRKHQKYFCAVDERGNLLPVFFAVLNTRAKNPEIIRQGHERVLAARLRDAEFFWHEDRKNTLLSRQDQLSRVTYNEKLGPDHKSYSKKIDRMLWIAEEIMMRQLKRREIYETVTILIHVCKTDLVTHMVGEFPELQGIMAGLYAREEGYPEEQWQALYDQYRPVTAEDSLPRNEAGALLSLTDRIEALVSGYVLNMIPTGSRDPFALRRIATGAMRIILACGLELDLQAAFTEALKHAPLGRTKMNVSDLTAALVDLMEARFRFLMEQKGIPTEYLNAVLNVEKQSFVQAAAKVEALWELKDSEDLKTLARLFKRISNIIQDQPDAELNEELLVEDGEKRLYHAFQGLHVQQNIDAREYSDALEIMVTLGPEIDNFFDEVLVMAGDVNLKNNRIALLKQISRQYRQIADFSALQMEL